MLAAFPAAAQETPAVTVVNPVPLERGPLQHFTGSLTSERHAALSPRVSGLVSRVLVDAGDRVAQGAVLLELDSTLAQLELQRAEAAMDEALTRLDEAQRVRDEGEALGSNIPMTVRLGRAADVVVQAAALARIEAERRIQAEIVARHRLVAPFDGVVSRKRAEAGEWVETGTPVLELLATDRLRLDIQVPQEHFSAVAPGAPVTVTLDSAPGRAFAGQVAAKVPLSDPAVRTFLVRVLIDNPSGDMVAGMSAGAAFRLSGERTVLSLPRDVLKRYPDGTTSVWVVENDAQSARAFERKVLVAATVAETVDVIDGLAADARVVLRGNEILKEGQSVRVIDESAMR